MKCIKHKYHLLHRREGYISGGYYLFGCEGCGDPYLIQVKQFWS